MFFTSLNHSQIYLIDQVSVDMSDSSCFNLPKSPPLILRRPQLYRKRFRILSTLEPRARAAGQSTTSTTQTITVPTKKAESFLKKTHNNFQIRYKNTQEELFFDEAKQILSKSESYYLELAKRLNFSEWQIKLLIRDIVNLQKALSYLPQWEHHHNQRCISNNLFRVIAEFLSQTGKCYLLDFLIQLNFHLSLASHSKVVNYDPWHRDGNYDSRLKNLEFIIKNIQIKTTIEGYQSGVFKEHPIGKLEPLYFNIIDEIRKQEKIPFPRSTVRNVRELEDMTKTPPDANYFIIPSSYDVRVWMAVIVGPPDSIYHGGIFYILIETPQEYPFKPPRLRALNKIFHPQINEENGAICLDELYNSFSPALMVHNIISKLCECLKVPNMDCYVGGYAMEAYIKKYDIEKIARNYVEKFA